MKWNIYATEENCLPSFDVEIRYYNSDTYNRFDDINKYGNKVAVCSDMRVVHVRILAN